MDSIVRVHFVTREFDEPTLKATVPVGVMFERKSGQHTGVADHSVTNHGYFENARLRLVSHDITDRITAITGRMATNPKGLFDTMTVWCGDVKVGILANGTTTEYPFDFSPAKEFSVLVPTGKVLSGLVWTNRAEMENVAARGGKVVDGLYFPDTPATAPPMVVTYAGEQINPVAYAPAVARIHEVVVDDRFPDAAGSYIAPIAAITAVDKAITEKNSSGLTYARLMQYYGAGRSSIAKIHFVTEHRPGGISADTLLGKSRDGALKSFVIPIGVIFERTYQRAFTGRVTVRNTTPDPLSHIGLANIFPVISDDAGLRGVVDFFRTSKTVGNLRLSTHIITGDITRITCRVATKPESYTSHKMGLFNELSVWMGTQQAHTCRAYIEQRGTDTGFMHYSASNGETHDIPVVTSTGLREVLFGEPTNPAATAHTISGLVYDEDRVVWGHNAYTSLPKKTLPLGDVVAYRKMVGELYKSADTLLGEVVHSVVTVQGQIRWYVYRDPQVMTLRNTTPFNALEFDRIATLHSTFNALEFDRNVVVPILRKLETTIAMYILTVRLCELYIYQKSLNDEDLEILLRDAKHVLVLLLHGKRPDYTDAATINPMVHALVDSNKLAKTSSLVEVVFAHAVNNNDTLNQGTFLIGSFECKYRNKNLLQDERDFLDRWLPQRDVKGIPYATIVPGDFHNVPSLLLGMRRYLCALVYIFNCNYAESDKPGNAKVLSKLNATGRYVALLGNMLEVFHSRLGAVLNNQNRTVGGKPHKFGWSSQWQSFTRYSDYPDHKNWPRANG